MENTSISDEDIKNAILNTNGTGAYLIKIIQNNNVCVTLYGHNVSNNYRFYVALSYYSIENINRIKSFKYNLGSWTIESYVTNTDLQAAIATGNTVRQCVNATTNSQTKKFLIARPDDAPIYESSRALLTVTKYITFTFLMLHSSLNEVFVAFVYESDNITPSMWKRMDNTVRNFATEGRLGLDYNATTKILSLYLGSNKIGTINVN